MRPGPRGRCDLGVVASHQVIDTPAVAATVTQYDEHAVACALREGPRGGAAPGRGTAGDRHLGAEPAGLAVFLLVMHHVPVERCAGILEALTGTEASDGFVHSLLARAARAVAGRAC